MLFFATSVRPFLHLFFPVLHLIYLFTSHFLFFFLLICVPVWTTLTGHGPARIPLIVKEELQVPHAPFASGNHPQVIKKPELQIITTMYNNQIITA
jgi:hypothetical protein